MTVASQTLSHGLSDCVIFHDKVPLVHIDPMAWTKGWVYNLDVADVSTRAGRLIAICLAFPIIATLAVLLRFGVRIRTGRSVGPDDYCVLASLVSTILTLP